MAEYRGWRNVERVWLKDVLPLDTPYNLYIEPSSMCNARCVYCGQSVQPGNLNISWDVFSKVIKESHGFPKKIKLIDFYCSGEPLCNPDLEKMIAYTKKENVANRLGITTNGILLTHKRIDGILDAGIDEIRVSIQGINAEIYSKICGVNIDFDEFLSNLKYLYKQKGNCKVRMKIADISLKNEIDGRKKFEKMFGEIADSIYIENIIPVYDNVQYENIDMEINDSALHGRNGMIQHEIHKVCYRPFIKLAVASNGDVTAACCSHPVKDIIYGNIKNANIVDLWNSSQRNSFLKMQLEGKRFNHPYCKDCIIPNDVSHEKDILDPYAEEILARFNNRQKRLPLGD